MRFYSQIVLVVEHHAKDKDAAFAQQPQLAARAAEAIQDGVVAPVVAQGTHMLYGPQSREQR